MTNGSTETQPINDFPPGYNTANSDPDEAPSQTAILIENEQLRAENEVARAVLTEHRRQQEENNRCCSGPGAACGGLRVVHTSAILFFEINVGSDRIVPTVSDLRFSLCVNDDSSFEMSNLRERIKSALIEDRTQPAQVQRNSSRNT